MGHIGRSTGTEVKDETLRDDKEESEGKPEKKARTPGTLWVKNSARL